MRPGEQPLFLDARCADEETVAESHAVNDDVDLVERWFVGPTRQPERLLRGALHIPLAVRVSDGITQEPEGIEHVALARGVRAVDRDHGKDGLGNTVDLE